jgi:TRAP-type C4-dicarboxylate transport system permease small subunit
MIKQLERWAHATMAVIRVVSGAMLVGSVAVNFANIIGRYFLSVSIQWAEEVMLFLMIACVFLNCGLVGWSGRQIRMDAFVAMCHRGPRAVVEMICELG